MSMAVVYRVFQCYLHPKKNDSCLHIPLLNLISQGRTIGYTRPPHAPLQLAAPVCPVPHAALVRRLWFRERATSSTTSRKAHFNHFFGNRTDFLERADISSRRHYVAVHDR
jgi:hypothetical protein